VTPTNRGRGTGDNLGLATDFAGEPRPVIGRVDVGAYNASRPAG